MKTKKVKILGVAATLLRYKKMWVFPEVLWYQAGLGSPVAVTLYWWRWRWWKFWQDPQIEYYTTITVNIPDSERQAGWQFIDTNNNGGDVVEWLEKYGFGKLVGRSEQSGFCRYPLFDFYSGEKFWEYRETSLKLNPDLDIPSL